VPTDRARDVLADPAAAKRLLERAGRKAETLGRKLPKRVWDQISLLRRMVTAYVKGEYRHLPKQTILLAIGALLYFVIPLDVIPDWIVGLGLIDDATVIAFVLNSIQQDVARFKKWEAKASPKKAGGAPRRAKPSRPGSRRRSRAAA
jgi:uncharacterized membrane protein YkvA (DUF1232 family)